MKKIQKIRLTRKCIPLKTPFITALRKVEAVEFVRVCITFDDATRSYGEAPATKAITGEDLDTITHSIKKVTPFLIAHTPQKALEILHTQPIGSSAKAALDIALYFANHKHIQDAPPIETDITISFNDTQTMLDDATKAIQEGHTLLKIKLGSEIQHAITTTRKLRETLPQATLLIDANQAWSLEESITYLDATNNLKLSLIEQPVAAHDLESLRVITQHATVPILADEAVFTLEDAKNVIENRYADMINIKLMKCGGVTKAIEILEYARQKNIQCMLGSMLEGPISINAAVYLAHKYKDVIAYVDLDSPLLYAGVSQEVCYKLK